MSILQRFSKGVWNNVAEVVNANLGEYTPEVKIGNREYSLRVLIERAEKLGFDRSERSEIASEYWRGFEEFTVKNPIECVGSVKEITTYKITREYRACLRAENKMRSMIDELHRGEL